MKNRFRRLRSAAEPLPKSCCCSHRLRRLMWGMAVPFRLARSIAWAAPLL